MIGLCILFFLLGALVAKIDDGKLDRA